MTQENLNMLEFGEIINMLADMAICPAAKDRALGLKPYETADDVTLHAKQTSSARRILDACGAPPLSNMEGMDGLRDKLGKGMVLPPRELSGVARFLNTCRLLNQYMKKAYTIDPLVAQYGLSIDPLSFIREEIERCVRGDYVDDRASAELSGIRRKKEQTAAKIKDKLNSMLRAHPEWYQDSYYSQRGERIGLPVKAAFRKMLPGTVIDASGSGATVFIEPDAVRALREQADLLQIEEENEIYRILSTLSNLIEANMRAVSINIEAMEQIDFCFAKAKLGLGMRGVTAELSTRKEILLDTARHPLLGEKAVPLTVSLGKTRAMIITGPNTGGKTVALKTIGLLSLMALSGLQVPARAASVPLFSDVLCDIGDGQSIQQSLSTFSSHVVRLVNVLNNADGKSLVLLDELGAGTDPAEGMGLATAVLEEIGRRSCILIATTHYPEIKIFARETPGFMNARMEFDLDTLKPLYRLIPQEAGESCALHIAGRLGVPKYILDRAWKLVYPEGVPQREAPPTPPHMKEESEPGPTPGAERGREQTPSAEPELMPAPSVSKPRKVPVGAQYRLGDSVYVTSLNRTGIVSQERNSRGEIGVQVLGQKVIVKEQRLRMNIKKEELYPGEEYDLDIVLDTVENRKAKTALRKGKKDAVVIIAEGKEI